MAEDLGGAQGRKIYFFVPEGRVLLKRIKDVTEELIDLENNYKGSLFRKRTKSTIY